MTAYDVYLGRKNIDTVFYGSKPSGSNRIERQEDVRRSLINHDGYDSDIVVRERREKKIEKNARRGLRRNPETTKARPIPGMFYSIWFSGRGGQTTKLVVKGEILKKASIANLSRMFPYFEVSKLQKLHTAGPYNSFDEAFLNR
jgi:hypothetical protein